MDVLTQLRAYRPWSIAIVVVAVTTAVLSWMNFRSTAAGMVFLVLVVWMATRLGTTLSLFSALLCAVSFDYFFLTPVHTFTLAGPQEWVAMSTFIASSIVASRVAEMARRQALNAEQRREDVERLHMLGQEMMLYDDAARLIGELPRLIARIFSLDSVAIYVREPEQYVSSSDELPESLRSSLAALNSSYSAPEMVPGEVAAMPLMLGLHNVGGLGWRPAKLSREVSTAVCAQVGIALARVLAIEAAARSEAQREGDRLRTALVDSLTHELRTPLTSIRAAATTLLEGGEGLDEATRVDLAQIVDEESARLDALIGEAVEMAEIDANLVKVTLEPNHPRTLLQNAAEKSKAALSRHQVVIAAEEPDTLALFDPHLLGRVLRHLLENAARYTPAGSRIVLRSRRVAGKLEFAVEDDGPGIDPADRPLVFEKFYRGKHSSSKGKGTGMGLAIVRAIVIAHGGDIDVLSVPGHGTTFRFRIPLIEKESQRQ
ncbi:MAG: ATP-binding protein [Terracidiphilus sp.]|nr:ATP-binding protein [Terracidiphilus sp.]